MPSYISEQFLNTATDDWDAFITTMLSQFDANMSPSWFAQLQDPARTYFMTRWMGSFRDRYDIQGTSWDTMTGLKVTTLSDNVPTTVPNTVSFKYDLDHPFVRLKQLTKEV